MGADNLAPANEAEGRAQSHAIVSFSHVAEPVPERIRRLLWEAKVLAADHTTAFGSEMLEFAAQAREIADGGEAYPPGVRELATRIAVDLEITAKSLVAILRQVGPRS
jgi:hypothetical protein